MSTPTPLDIMNSRYLKKETGLVKMANKFYDNPISGIQYSKLNQGNWPPTIKQIGDYQMSEISLRMPIDPKLQKIANNLTKDIIIPFNEEEIVVEEALSKIEEALSYQEEGSAARLSKSISTESLNSLMQKYEGLKFKLTQVYDLINKSAGRISGSLLQKNLNEVQKTINQIESEMQMIGVQGNDYQVSTEMVGYLKKADWLGKRLKGQYLETVGTQWFNKQVPNNIKVINVGDIMGPSFDILGNISGMGKKIRTDIMGFDLTKQIQISCKINNQEKIFSLIEFLDYVEKADASTNINLSEDGYAALQQALVFGVQAKAGKNQAIFNPKPVTLQQAISTEGIGSQYANNLSLLNKLVVQDQCKWIAKTHDYYDAMFNYCLAKGLVNIIGKDNNLVLTRNGVQLMKDYLLEQWSKGGKYIQARTRVHIDQLDRPIDVIYSSKSSN